MKSALALLLALIGLAGLVALSCTAPLAGAPCDCLAGYECDSVTNVCRAIGADGSPFSPADADVPRSDAAGSFIDSSLPLTDSGFEDASGGQADAGLGEADASSGEADASSGEADASLVGPELE